MRPLLVLFFIISMAAFTAIPKADALNPSVIYEVALDFNHDGTMDKAALVLLGDSKEGFFADKTLYMFDGKQQVDLYVYLGQGAAPIDLSKPPSILEKHFDRFFLGGFITPLTTGDQGSLILSTSSGAAAGYSGDFALTLVYRKQKLLVAGYDYNWETRDNGGACSINYLSGKATVQDGTGEPPKKPLKGKFKLVSLANWSEKKLPEVCFQ